MSKTRNKDHLIKNKAVRQLINTILENCLHKKPKEQQKCTLLTTEKVLIDSQEVFYGLGYQDQK